MYVRPSMESQGCLQRRTSMAPGSNLGSQAIPISPHATSDDSGLTVKSLPAAITEAARHLYRFHVLEQERALRAIHALAGGLPEETAAIYGADGEFIEYRIISC